MLPGGDLVSEDLLIGDAAVETLGRQDAEFRLRQIEPAAVLWRVMPFEPLDQPPGFGGRKGLESVRKVYEGLQSLRSMRRMEASRRNASALSVRFSKSLARRRQRLSQARVRSTTH